MLYDAISSFVDYIRANITGFDENNCKGFDDERVLDYIVAEDMSPNPQQGCIVSYGGVMRPEQASEFGGLIVQWIIIVSAFFPLVGSADDVQAQIAVGYAFIENLMNIVIADSTLGGQVMDCVILDGETPMEYTRNGVNKFLLISTRFTITENI